MRSSIADIVTTPATAHGCRSIPSAFDLEAFDQMQDVARSSFSARHPAPPVLVATVMNYRRTTATNIGANERTDDRRRRSLMVAHLTKSADDLTGGTYTASRVWRSNGGQRRQSINSPTTARKSSSGASTTSFCLRRQSAMAAGRSALMAASAAGAFPGQRLQQERRRADKLLHIHELGHALDTGTSRRDPRS